MIKNFTCIACPRGCALTVCFDDSDQKTLKAELVEVTGNRCPKGIAYGRQEIICPMRTLTTTMAYSLKHGDDDGNIDNMPGRLPVKTGREIPLSEMLNMMDEIRKMSAEKPVRYGDTVGHIFTSDGSEIPIIACAASE
ncbi:MAG: DUF1667 domain-containing protein [Treponemataceae bacterium]